MNAMQQYYRWKSTALKDPDLVAELQSITEQNDAIEDRFYRELAFGTGGLRGVIGAGTNRMNVYTVAKASQGYANYLHTIFHAPTIAIAYDSRIKSELFARTAAEVFAANGIIVFIFPELMPTPALSFAVRHLGCSGGIVITASHNPAKYNGYKVYGSDGCQITLEAAQHILAEINATDIFDDIQYTGFADAMYHGLIHYIGAETVTAYLSAVAGQAIRHEGLDRSVSIAYTPLSGTGLNCVTRCLRENGFHNIELVESQCQPDGNFPTCPYPNPEIREALEVGLRYARERDSDLLLATDPDCDRVGVAVRSGEDYMLMSGNEMGILLFDYICKSRIELGIMPIHPIVIKTIVTTEMLRPIAAHYGVEIINVLTGFKFIGEQIGCLEAKGRGNDYILGFEESCGYLTGGYARDKDAVDAALLVCEMLAYYRAQRRTLVEVLEQLYAEYGHYLNVLESFSFDGAKGFETMQFIMRRLREMPPTKVAEKKLIAVTDYASSVKTAVNGEKTTINLPSSNVLQFEFAGNVTVTIRPSGTEPKLKLYYSVQGTDMEAAKQLLAMVQKAWRRCVLADGDVER